MVTGTRLVFSHINILGMSSSQLTKNDSYFSEGLKPPTRYHQTHNASLQQTVNSIELAMPCYENPPKEHVARRRPIPIDCDLESYGVSLEAVQSSLEADKVG